jgi:hypothetical protein
MCIAEIIENKKLALFLLNCLILLSILLFPYGDFSYIKIFISMILLFNIPGFLILKYFKVLRNQNYFFTIFITSFVIGFSIWLFFLFITSLLKVPISSSIVRIFPILTLILFIYILIKEIISKKNLSFVTISKQDLILMTLFNALLFVYLYPTRGLIVAPLHDPAAISIFSKYLIESKYIFTDLPNLNLFYPPAGYYLMGLISDFAQTDPSTTTMIMTNICNALSGFSFALFVSNIFKLKKLAWVPVYVFCFLSIYPGTLYFSAGKNAQVIAFVFLFVSMYLFHKALGGNFLTKILFGLSIFASILMHYNNLLISIIFCLSIYLYKILSIKNKGKFLKRYLFHWFLIFLPLLLLFFFVFSVIRNTTYFYSSILRPLETEERFLGLISLRDFFEWFTGRNLKHINNINSYTILLFGLGSYIFLMLNLTYSWLRKRKFNKMILFCIFFLLLFYFALYIEIGAITRYFGFNKLIPFLIAITLSFSIILNKKIIILKKVSLNIILILLFFAVGINNVSNIYNSYIDAKFVSVVNEEDLKAFEWINNNLDQKEFIIPAHIQFKNRYILDSSLYMKAYTNNYELFGFVRGEIPANQNNLVAAYLKLKSEPQNEALLEEFTSSNIHYIFSGSHKPWGCGELPCGHFDLYPDLYEVVYDIDGVRIYRINLNK